jgi:hypothetical protein
VGGGDGAAAEWRDCSVPELGGEGGGAARVARQKAAAVGFAEPKARGDGFIGWPREASTCGPGQRTGGFRAVPWPDLGSSPSLAQGRGRPRQAGPACQRERRGGGSRAAGPRGEEKSSCWAGPLGEESKKKRPARLGRAGVKEKEGREVLGRAKRREREKERKKCIQIHLNLNLKFKFKWKTSNETMQFGMKCTRFIFLFIIYGKCSKIKIIE